jgi:UDP-2,3-diacylglucosamine hydrolase
MTGRTKIYFASDFHLGVPDEKTSLVREKRIVRWLEQIKSDASELFLMGDVFDFWFEYKTVVPKGFVRLLGKLSELSDLGIKLHFFTGNHDMWVTDYLEKELNVNIHKEPVRTTILGKKFFLGHGDGLGPGDKGYKFIKRIFKNSLSQWLFRMIHPDLGIRIANYWSRKSRISTGESEAEFLGDENEWLLIFSKKLLETEYFDYCIFGHRHLPLDIKINDRCHYINLGDWITHNSYAVFDGDTLKLDYYSG